MKKVAVFFPGIGYHCDKPLLYYGRKLAMEAGFDECINVSYSCDWNIVDTLEKLKETADGEAKNIDEQLKDVNLKDYDQILFVSKSLGTIVATAYAEKKELPNVQHVLFTPIRDAFSYECSNAIAFLGTSDPVSNYPEIAKLAQEKNVPLYKYENGNHSLETGSVDRNLEIMRDVMQKVKEFIK